MQTNTMTAYLAASKAATDYYSQTLDSARDVYRSGKMTDTAFYAIQVEHARLLAVFDTAEAALKGQP